MKREWVVTDNVTDDVEASARIPSVSEYRAPSAGVGASSPAPAQPATRAIGSTREARLNLGLAVQMLFAVGIIMFAAKWIWFTPPKAIDQQVAGAVSAMGAVAGVEHPGVTPPAMVAAGEYPTPLPLPTPAPTPVIVTNTIERVVEVEVPIEVVRYVEVDRPVIEYVDRVVEVERIVEVDPRPVPGVGQAVVCISTGAGVTAVYLDGVGIPSGCHTVAVGLVTDAVLRFTGSSGVRSQ